jgi:hypothetical protein
MEQQVLLVALAVVAVVAQVRAVQEILLQQAHHKVIMVGMVAALQMEELVVVVGQVL